MIVRGVGGKGALGVARAIDDVAPIGIPVRNADTGDAERFEMRSHIVWHTAEVFAHDFTRSRRSDDGAQAAVAIVAVGIAIFLRIVIAPSPLGESSAGALLGFFRGQIDHFGIALRPPRKGVNAIEAEDVIDAKGADDATEAKWFRLDKLPELAFDHAEILKRAAGRVADRSE